MMIVDRQQVLIDGKLVDAHEGSTFDKVNPATEEIIGEVVERPDLIDDSRFFSHQALAANAFEAKEILQAEFTAKPLVHWCGRLESFKGQWAVVQDNIEVRDDPQVEANVYVVETETKGGATFPLVATAVQVDEQASRTLRAPEFNEHGDKILTDLAGFD